MTAKLVTIDGVCYKKGDCLILEVTDLDVPVLLRIVHITSYDGIRCIVGNLTTCLSYLPHFHAYAVAIDLDWLIIRPETEL